MTADLAVREEFSSSQLTIIKKSVAKDLNDDEFALFIEVCKRSKLDPFRRQIYAIKRKSDRYGDKVSHQTGIDGFRVIAQRTGAFAGILGPYWCGPDGVWVDVWLSDKPPSASKVGILRTGFSAPVWGVARFRSFYQQGGAGLWDRMPDVMIAKCAEAQAHRKAFPEDLAGLYTDDEMGQQTDAPPLAHLEMADAPNVRPVQEATIESFRAELESATDVELLTAIVRGPLAEAQRTGVITKAQVDDLLITARAKRAALQGAAATAPVAPTPPAAPAPAIDTRACVACGKHVPPGTGRTSTGGALRHSDCPAPKRGSKSAAGDVDALFGHGPASAAPDPEPTSDSPPPDDWAPDDDLGGRM